MIALHDRTCRSRSACCTQSCTSSARAGLENVRDVETNPKKKRATKRTTRLGIGSPPANIRTGRILSIKPWQVRAHKIVHLQVLATLRACVCQTLCQYAPAHAITKLDD